jgi:hypothetical protein
MADNKSTLWSRDRIIDEFHRPRRPLVLIVAVIGLVVLCDLLLDLALRTTGPHHDIVLHDAATVRSQIAHAADDPGQPWLLIGDSVLAGDVAKGIVEDWESRRVIDFLRQEKNGDAPDAFYQTALNGLLPVDIRRIAAELDRQDPQGRVGLIIELTPRNFSRHYAEVFDCTRDYLNKIGPPLISDDRTHWLKVLGQEADVSADWLGNRLPVFRHKDTLSIFFSLRNIEGLAVSTSTPTVADEALAFARVREHFQDWEFGPQSAQVEALADVVALCRAAGRMTVFFTTPINDAFMQSAASRAEYGKALATLDALISSADHPEVSLVHLDHPLFVPAHFFDHIHLLPEGNRLLALNLLHELNVPLRSRPAATEMVHPEALDRTLIANAEQGFADGTSWQALLDGASAVAVAPGGGRVVVADTGNHCLRVLEGNKQTLRVLAGEPGKPGHEDGAAVDALLEAPGALAFAGDDLYFADGAGTRLRRLRHGMVETIDVTASKIRKLQGWGGEIFVLDEAQRILAFEPHASTVRVAVQAQEPFTVSAFTIAPNGTLYLADGQSRIWQGDARADALFTRGTRALSPLFTNTGSAFFPMANAKQRAHYPYSFDDALLGRIDDMEYVPAYDGLLLHETIVSRRLGDNWTQSLRFMHPGQRKIYPWIKPHVTGEGYMFYNESSSIWLTEFRKGSIAIEPQTSTVFYLEHDRSRLIQMSDGIWGAAKTGHVSTIEYHGAELFGKQAGHETLLNLEPWRHLGKRLERLERRGPYTVLMIGGSFTGMTDALGQYSMGRALERELNGALGYQNHLRIEVLPRVVPGASLPDVVEELELDLNLGYRVDAILLEIHSRDKAYEGITLDDLTALLPHIQDLAAMQDAPVVFFDNSGMESGGLRDGLRATGELQQQFLQFAQDAGFPVIRLTELLMPESLEVGLWGEPPLELHHASHEAILAASRALSAQLAPYLAKVFADRTPAYLREDAGVFAAEDAGTPLVQAFEEAGRAADTFAEVDFQVRHRTFRNRHLEVFLDVAKLKTPLDLSVPENLRAVALTILRDELVGNAMGKLATKATVRLAKFPNYDEYGQGVLEQAEYVFDETFEYEVLKTALVE